MSGQLDELEARLLASLPSVEHFTALADAGITAGAFQHYGAMYAYIASIVQEHGHLPRLLDLKRTFNVPDHVRRKPAEYDWLLAEFRKINIAQQMQNLVERNVEQHGESPQVLIDSLIRDLTGIAVERRRAGSTTDTSMVRRMHQYQEMMPEDGLAVRGIPTGLSYFDAEWRLGWLPGELEGVVGRIYTGKTWLLMYFGVLAWRAGHKVVMLSPELPEEEAEARFDVLTLAMNDVQVQLKDLYRGFKPTDQMLEVATRVAKDGRWKTLSSIEDRAFRLSEIQRIVRQHQPTMLLVDGVPYIETDKPRQSGWEVIKEVSYGLKSIAVANNIVVLASTQATRSAHNVGRPPGLHEISYGDAFGQACDRVIAISRPMTKPNILRVTVQKFRKGQPQHGGIDLHFDPERGRIHELFDKRATGKSRRNGQGVQAGPGDAATVLIP